MRIIGKDKEFQCENSNCKVYKSTIYCFVWSDRKKNPLCDFCKEELKEVIKISINNGPFVLKFSSMSSLQKQNMLRKRSKDHFHNSNLEEKRYNMLTKNKR